MAKLGAIAAIATGAALMYALDPVQGRRRRARIRDASRHWIRIGARTFEKKIDDASNRVHGLSVRFRTPPRPADDDVLVSRVRALLGHVSSRPHAMQVKAQDGVVELSGPIRAGEADHLLVRVRRVPGVVRVLDRMERSAA